jgi:hypothetical protein
MLMSSDEKSSLIGDIICEVCGKKGHFRYGVCLTCRPTCQLCGKKINAPKGTTVHPACIAKLRKKDAEFKSTDADIRKIRSTRIDDVYSKLPYGRSWRQKTPKFGA